MGASDRATVTRYVNYDRDGRPLTISPDDKYGATREQWETLTPDFIRDTLTQISGVGRAGIGSDPLIWEVLPARPTYTLPAGPFGKTRQVQGQPERSVHAIADDVRRRTGWRVSVAPSGSFVWVWPPARQQEATRAISTTETRGKQCGSCGWMLSEHWTGGVCPEPARELCGSCEAGLPMSCICVPAPTETGECPECGASADEWCRDGCRPVDPVGYR